MFDVERFVSRAPESEPHLRRLNALLRTAAEPPRIAVLGKYNHGKSSLLNALLGIDYFGVSDKRETVDISCYSHNGVVWIDTPGLDADPAENDDQKARKVAFEIADFLCLVHAVTEGELDRSEIETFVALGRQDKTYRRKMVLVLTKIDQVDPSEVKTVKKKCRDQLQKTVELRELDVLWVSVKRHGNSRLRSLSRMDRVFARVEQWTADIASLRQREWCLLTGNVLGILSDKLRDGGSELKTARYELSRVRQELRADVAKLCEEVGRA